MLDTPKIIIRSEKFSIRIGEDTETNPFLYGKELAEWLRNELVKFGHEIEEVIPEDWGWCVMFQRTPFRLIVGVVNGIDQKLVDGVAIGEPPKYVLWHIVPIPEVPFWRRSAMKELVEKQVEELNQRLIVILESEPGIRLLTDSEVEEWEDTEPEDLVIPEELMPAPALVPRWVTLPLGLLLIPVLILCVFGGISLFIDPPEDVATARYVIGTVVIAACYGFGVVVFRLITGKESPYGGLFPPGVLKGLSFVFASIPIGLGFTGFYSDEPIRSLMVATVWIAMAIGMWRTARRRLERAAPERKAAL